MKSQQISQKHNSQISGCKYPLKKTTVKTQIPKIVFGKTFEIDRTEEKQFYGHDFDNEGIDTRATTSQFTVFRLLTALCNGNAFKEKVKFRFSELINKYEYEDPELEFKLESFDAFTKKLKQFLDAGKKDYQFFDEIGIVTGPNNSLEKCVIGKGESGIYFEELSNLVSIPSVAAIINIDVDPESEEFIEVWSTPIIERSNKVIIRNGNGEQKIEKNVWHAIKTPIQLMQHDDHFTLYEDGITDFAVDTIDAYQEIIFDSICGEDSIKELGLDQFVAALLIYLKWHLIAPQFVIPNENPQNIILDYDNEDMPEDCEECDSGNGTIVVSAKDGTIVMIKKYEIIAYKIVITEIIYVQEIKRKKFIFDSNLEPIAFCL